MFKRRRINFRRRRFRRGSRFGGTTNRASGPTSIGRFRTRKTPKSVFRRWLWQSTMSKSHYRSIRATTTAMSTPNDIVNATLAVFIPGTDGINPFWTTGGGFQPEDTGITPTFLGDITLRGGVSRISIANRVTVAEATATDAVRVTVFTVWNNPNVPGFTFPATVPITWDPSVFPDFQRNGKVIGRKEAILSATGDTLELFFRHKIQLIDQPVYNNNGSRLAYFVLVSQVTNTEAVAAPETVDVVLSWNYSFSADSQ